MKVVVNASSMTRQATGIGRYTRGLLSQLINDFSLDIKAFDHAHLWPDSQSLASWLHEPGTSGGKNDGWVQRCYPLLRRLPGRFVLARMRLKRQLNKLKRWEVYWEPDYLPVDFSTRRPVVPVIHDMAWWRHPEYVHPVMCRQLARYLPNVVRQAARINVVSAFTRTELCERFEVEPQKIDIVSPAASHEFQPGALTAQLAEHFMLPERYILSVATLEPRKNLSRLLRAYQALPSSLRQGCPLLLVGRRGWLDEKLRKQVDTMQASGEVRWLGYVPGSALPGLMAGATLMAYPSLYEGFGMPVLESLACGTPVLTSDVASLPEVAGDTAVYVEPTSIDSIRQGLHTLLDDTELRARLSQEGPVRAQHFSWASSAMRLKDSLKNAAYEHDE
ncbi:glycosyltransferase family 1 protein [Modicisalibacter sp. 'Wilcox']|uniref:glycosyltransferase family 4 protein n=1 Tax=Modicisalibacter sp. 'Wilcox' TaxID=2679914 RepID=UPI0013CF88FB|nr:glycosyltransferase family 1 protein [Modicisalibacter sp. 'Wilcox']